MDTTTHTQIDRFTRLVAESIADQKPGDAADFIAKLHAADVDALEARLAAASQECAHAIAESSRTHYLLEGVLATATRETYRAAQLHARAECTGQLLRMLGAMAETAEDGNVSAQDIIETLASPVPPTPFRPYIAAFCPSAQYSRAHFATDDGAVHRVFPFAGWSTVIHEPGHGTDRLVPTVLVDQELQPAPTLLIDRGLHLQQLV